VQECIRKINLNRVFFVVAPCMLIILKSSLVQIMRTNSYKTVKLLESFKIIIVAPTCFGLHKPSSRSSQPVLRQSYNVDNGNIYLYLKLSVLWLPCSNSTNSWQVAGSSVQIFGFFKIREIS
jgi:hypothetical protein